MKGKKRGREGGRQEGEGKEGGRIDKCTDPSMWKMHMFILEAFREPTTATYTTIYPPNFFNIPVI